MTEKRAVNPGDAPTPYGGGHYSPGVVAGDFVFTSGQGPLLPGSNVIVGDDVTVQTAQTIANLDAVLAASGSSLSRIVKATVYLSDLSDWGAFDRVWREQIPGTPPARTAVRADLLAGMLVEIDVVALL